MEVIVDIDFCRLIKHYHFRNVRLLRNDGYLSVRLQRLAFVTPVYFLVDL